MKKTSLLIACVAFLLSALAVPALAAGKEITITGECKCGKCALHETDKCQNVIETEEKGKTVSYYLAQNKVSKDFHENVCKESHKVTATGTVKDVDGKKVLTASKLELVK